jgi:hypothetical protein
MLGEEELPGHLGPHPGPVCSGQASAGGQVGRRIDCRDAFGHLQLERAEITIDNP